MVRFLIPDSLFADRRDAGHRLAATLEGERGPKLVVVGLARGGVETAAEVARELDAPLDVVAVRKIGHPSQPEYGIGAVTPGDGVYMRARDGLTDEQVAAAVEESKAKATLLDRRLHADHPPVGCKYSIGEGSRRAKTSLASAIPPVGGRLCLCRSSTSSSAACSSWSCFSAVVSIRRSRRFSCFGTSCRFSAGRPARRASSHTIGCFSPH